MTCALQNVVGVGSHTESILKELGYQSAEDLAAASEADLIKIPGFGSSRAQKIIASAKEAIATFTNALEQTEKKLMISSHKKKKKIKEKNRSNTSEKKKKSKKKKGKKEKKTQEPKKKEKKKNKKKKKKK